MKLSTQALLQLADVDVFPIAQEHNKTRLIVDHCRSILTRRAYTIYAYESSDFRRRLCGLLRDQDFVLVHVDSLDLSGYLPLLMNLPVVCVHHNVESDLLRRRAQTLGGLSGGYLRLQAKLTEREERKWCPRVDLNVAVSPADRESFGRLAPSASFVVIPNGVDTSMFRPRETEGRGIVFVGSHSWQPNRDAMEYFCTEVLPLLRSSGLTVPVTWIGRAPPKAVRDYAERYDVTLTGFVDDIRPIVQSAACYIAPLRAGGGTRLKILDAWAMGKAVVSTSVGCEGLDTCDGENILIADGPADFAKAVATVLTNSDLRRRLGVQARRTAERRYDWEVIGGPMIAQYRQLASIGT